MDAFFPPWWHEGTARPSEVLTGVVRDQRDYQDAYRECPLYEIELTELATLTVGVTVNREWTISTREFAAGDVVTVRASCHILMAELAVRAPVENGERVRLGYAGKRDPSDPKSVHLFTVKKLDRKSGVNHAKYAQQLGEDVVPSDIPSDGPRSQVDRGFDQRAEVQGGAPRAADDTIPFSASAV